MTPLCLRYKYGHCKYGGTCIFKHININCELDTCQLCICENHHPRECYWFRDYQWCKFRPCNYKHTLIQNILKQKTQNKLDDFERK